MCWSNDRFRIYDVYLQVLSANVDLSECDDDIERPLAVAYRHLHVIQATKENILRRSDEFYVTRYDYLRAQC